MDYEIEELVPIVAKLAEDYTFRESTSIPYDRAQQLMEAVLYSIREGERAGQCACVPVGELSAAEMYAVGAACVEKKTKETLHLYNGLMTHFSDYGNRCLQDTVVRGLPEFFKWYDCKYEPQDTILTLDYPVLEDLSGDTGIDKIYNFIVCIQVEQRFLNGFPPETVRQILYRYDKRYGRMIDNLCEIVLAGVIGHVVTGQPISVPDFAPEEFRRLQTWIVTQSPDGLQGRLQTIVKGIVREYYEMDEALLEYLNKAVDNIAVRLRNAAEHGTLDCIL